MLGGMYDSVNMRLFAGEAAGVDFLEEVPCRLDQHSVAEHIMAGFSWVTGKLGNLSVRVTDGRVDVYGGSLCRWYLGNNVETMGRHDVQEAVMRLSDTLHLPMDRAEVTRLDVAENFIMRQPVDVYLGRLGRWGKALPEPRGKGIYYHRTAETLCFYDKVAEQEQEHNGVPSMYEGKNVLRYEQRFAGRLSAAFKVGRVTGGTLYDVAFYKAALARWRDTYRSIRKTHEIKPRLDVMKGKKEFYRVAALAYIEQFGGELQFMRYIDEARKCGEVDRKTAYQLRQAVEEVCKSDSVAVSYSEAIKELDKKITEAVLYYR